MDPNDTSYLKDLFYESGADVTLKFKDEKNIRINRSLLAAMHKAFFKLLFIDEKTETIEINDFNADLFRLFLDCMMGFKKKSKKNVLLIFPIAFKFGIEDLMSRWLEFSKSEKVNQDWCLSFNVVVSNKMELPKKVLIELLKKDGGIYKLLEQDDLCFLLEPESMLVLLTYIELDSCAYDILFKWGRNYLKSKKGKDLKKFFNEVGFSSIIFLENFETVKSILEFHKNDSGYFSDKEILDYIRNNHLTSICDSQWVNVKNGDFIEEVFHLQNLFLNKDCSVELNIFRNNAVFYNYRENELLCPIHYVLLYETLHSGDKLLPRTCQKNFHEDGNKNSNRGSIQVIIKNFGEEFVLTKIKIKYIFKTDTRILKTVPKFNLRISHIDVNKIVCFTKNILLQYA